MAKRKSNRAQPLTFEQWLESENREPSDRLRIDLKAAFEGGKENQRLTQRVECLANRVAQPVVGTQFKPVADLFALGWENGEVCSYITDPEKAVLWLTGYTGTCVQEYVKLERLQEAYTAPPAPAVPRVTSIPDATTLTNINQLCPMDSNLSQTDFSTGWNDCRQYAITNDGVPPVAQGWHSADQGWNACRAAMLAAPKGGK